MTTAPAPAPQPTPVLVIILLSYLMIVLGISIVITALPKMHQALGFSATGLSCVQNAYTLAFGGLLLLSARAGDILGRRRMFVAGLALFTAASLAIGLAPSAAWLLTASAVQGIGAATLAPSTLALLTASFPEGRERTRAVAYYGAVAGGVGARLGLAHRVSTALTAGTGMLAVALVLVVALIARPGKAAAGKPDRAALHAHAGEQRRTPPRNPVMRKRRETRCLNLSHRLPPRR